MIVNVLKRKNVNTETLSKFVEWFCESFIKDDRVSIVVDVTNKIDNNGMCSCSLFGDSIIAFNVELNKSLAFNEDYLLYVLGHELWHVRQYAKGFLKDTDTDNISIWKGKKIDESSLPYKKLPWEKDAFRNEKRVNKDWKSFTRMELLN